MILDFENLEFYIKKYAYTYDLCENQKSRLRFHLKDLLEKNQIVSTMDLDELCKKKSFINKKLKVVK
jgi:hypothetical protein